jgi:hypothetical protein
MIGVSTHPARRWSLLALAALLGLAVIFSATSASGASSGHAVAAKKKHGCKKKGKKSAAAAKKKKCKKKKSPAPPSTPVSQPPAPQGPVVRADVTWTVTGVTDEADIDVHAFSNGAHTGYSEVTATEENQIPDLIDEPGFESAHERILDNTNPSTRGLTFAICSYYYDMADPAEVTYHFILANGSAVDGVVTMNPGNLLGIDPKEGGLITKPRADWCPLPTV